MCQVHDVNCAFLLNSCCVILMPGMLAYVAMGKIEEMLTAIVNVPSVIEMFFEVLFLTVEGPSHFHEYSRKTKTWAFGDIRYLLACGSFDVRALVIHCSATMFPTFFLSVLR